jgi:uncharacterized membrane protein
LIPVATPLLVPQFAPATCADRLSTHVTGGAPLAEPRLGSLGGPLGELRDRAERQLNAVRGAVLVILGVASAAYAPQLTPALRLVNGAILTSVLAWTVWQYVRWYGDERLPRWLALANPIVDVTAVTASMAGYALTESAALSLKAPMFLAYFVVLAARPVTSSPRIAAAVTALTVIEYSALVAFVVGSGRVALAASPVLAAVGGEVSLLDEGAKVLLLAVAGAVATYATAWHGRLALRYGEAAREQERLEVELTRNELERLKHQLQPHFLFNALNAVTALIPSDPAAAERTINGLGQLLRLSLDTGPEHEVTLGRELDLLGHYIDIQRIRFQERLTVRLFTEPAAHDALVPNLLIQPLVENAIRHGIGPKVEGGTVEVRAERVGEWLTLRVSDDGVGGAVGGEGVGIGNTRARLRFLYGTAHQLTVSAPSEGGWTVTIVLPFRVATDASGRAA